MPRLKNIHDLVVLRETLQLERSKISKIVTICAGTCTWCDLGRNFGCSRQRQAAN